MWQRRGTQYLKDTSEWLSPYTCRSQRGVVPDFLPFIQLLPTISLKQHYVGCARETMPVQASVLVNLCCLRQPSVGHL